MKRKFFCSLVAFILAAASCFTLSGCEERLERPRHQFATTSSVWLYTKDEYDAKCMEAHMNNKLAERFVLFDQVDSLGAFEKCHVKYSLQWIYPEITYYINDHIGITCVLFIEDWNVYAAQEFFGYKNIPVYPQQKTAFFNFLFGLPAEDNMLLFPKLTKKEESGYVRTQNEIWYGYGTDGNLVSVTWFYNDYRFRYYLREIEFSDYPDMDADTFAVKLLNVETAEQAIEELMRECFPDQEYTGLQRIKVPKFKN